MQNNSDILITRFQISPLLKSHIPNSGCGKLLCNLQLPLGHQFRTCRGMGRGNLKWKSQHWNVTTFSSWSGWEDVTMSPFTNCHNFRVASEYGLMEESTFAHSIYSFTFPNYRCRCFTCHRDLVIQLHCIYKYLIKGARIFFVRWKTHICKHCAFME